LKNYNPDFVYSDLPSLTPTSSQTQHSPPPPIVKKSRKIIKQSKKRPNSFPEPIQNKSRKTEINKKRKIPFPETIDRKERKIESKKHKRKSEVELNGPNSKKQKHSSPSPSPSQSQSQSPSSEEELYSLYVNFENLHISEIQTFDKQFHLSGLLSYQINYNWKKQNNIIELVETKQLWDYKEFDRTTTPKYSDCNSLADINKKFSSIKEKGFFEPLHINCNRHTKKCYVDEGNHRLTYYNNILFVPARVISSLTSDGVTIPFQHRDLPTDKLTASMLGFRTFSNNPKHPCLAHVKKKVGNLSKIDQEMDPFS